MDFSLLVLCMGMLIGGVSSLKALNGIMWLPDSKGILHALDVATPFKQDNVPLFFNGEKQVNLSLYTQQNPYTAERITLGDNSTYPDFNPDNPTRFVVHGWTADADRFVMVKDAYIDTGLDYNVVLVDWSGPAGAVYPIAMKYTRLVGEYLVKVIKNLEANRGLSLKALTLIGHSLGAHVAGIVGNNLGGKVARIVGLDAAAPLYNFVPKKYYLDKKDAKFVEAIHTNAGITGWKSPYGTVDFYPNGGTYQPGCGFDLGGFCSHSRSPFLYAESINSRNFVSTSCKSYSSYKKGQCARKRHDSMGEWTSRWSRGVKSRPNVTSQCVTTNLYGT